MTGIGTPQQHGEERSVHEAQARRNRRMLTALFGLALAMVGLAYAGVPLYNVFCRVTGYGGTTQEASAAPGAVLERTVKVQFDANIERDLPWDFKPEQAFVKIKVGEPGLAFYRARNVSKSPFVGQATFNVTPQKAGIYFTKVACFCFDEQLVLPGETVQMPVSFFVDPAIADDPNMDDITTITLSYTFFAVREPSEALRRQMDAFVQSRSEPSNGPKS